MDGYPTADCYPDRFLNGQHVFGPLIDSASQKDSLSQYQYDHVGYSFAILYLSPAEKP